MVVITLNFLFHLLKTTTRVSGWSLSGKLSTSHPHVVMATLCHVTDTVPELRSPPGSTRQTILPLQRRQKCTFVLYIFLNTGFGFGSRPIDGFLKGNGAYTAVNARQVERVHAHTPEELQICQLCVLRNDVWARI